MPRDQQHLEAVLAAAEALLSAREDQMLTSAEWDALSRAVEAATGCWGPARDTILAMIAEGVLHERCAGALMPDGSLCWEELDDDEARLVRERMAAGRGGEAE